MSAVLAKNYLKIFIEHVLLISGNSYQFSFNLGSWEINPRACLSCCGSAGEGSEGKESWLVIGTAGGGYNRLLTLSVSRISLSLAPLGEQTRTECQELHGVQHLCLIMASAVQIFPVRFFIWRGRGGEGKGERDRRRDGGRRAPHKITGSLLWQSKRSYFPLPLQ